MKKIVKNKKRVFVGLSPRQRSRQAGVVKKSKRVFVGMSGGVDSSVAAYLLKKQGYEVAGVFMRLKSRINADVKITDGRRSNSDEKAARLVAGKLGIPFYVFNFEAEFKKAVVDYFLRELRSGRTPNPCVVCNLEIKFWLFLEKAKKLGADLVATGHYAMLKKAGGVFKLFAAKDEQKDQSYFLYRLNQSQLSRAIFPLGGYTKEEVYKLAKQWRLPHQTRQSFDICFIGDYREFLRKYLKLEPGKIIDLAGKEIGKHAGLPFYTIGQRASLGGPGPFFVVKKDVKKNILYVSNNERDLYQKEMLVENVSWVAGVASELPVRCKVKIRYGGEATKAQIAKRKSQIAVIFDKSQRAITPGQSVVFYGRGGEVLGGGVII